MAALFGIVFVGFGRQIYGALGGSGEALDRAEAFATILFSGCVAHWVANSMASVLRGTGDMKTPGLALVVTAGIQIPLTGALTLGWFRPARLRHPRPRHRGGDSLRPRRAVDAFQAHRSEGAAAPALAAATGSAGARSATS